MGFRMLMGRTGTLCMAGNHGIKQEVHRYRQHGTDDGSPSTENGGRGRFGMSDVTMVVELEVMVYLTFAWVFFSASIDVTWIIGFQQQLQAM